VSSPSSTILGRIEELSVFVMSADNLEKRADDTCDMVYALLDVLHVCVMFSSACACAPGAGAPLMGSRHTAITSADAADAALDGWEVDVACLGKHFKRAAAGGRVLASGAAPCGDARHHLVDGRSVHMG
jgi:hypothetical protein